MTRRYDVSAVPLQGGYIAKWCPVRAQNNILQPGEPMPASDAAERRMDRGRQFEVGIVERLVALHPDAVVVTDVVAADRAESVVAAMRAGARLIIHARLPNDDDGRRAGEPDLLLRVQTAGVESGASPSYRPIDIKHHLSVGGVDGEAVCSDLSVLHVEAAHRVEAGSHRHKEDLLQLAHYVRLLEAAGFAAPDRWAGILGSEETVVWHDLDAPFWKTPSSSGKQKLRSVMDVYDFEFDFRLDVMAVAQQHLADPAVEPLLVPVRISECPACPWWSHCGPVLETGFGDVSLATGVGWREFDLHRRRGVHNRLELAQLDTRTAALVVGGVDVAFLRLAAAAAADPATPVEELMGRKKAQVSKLIAAGVVTAGDALGLCERTAAYSDAGMGGLLKQIDAARAALGPAPVYRLRGVEGVAVPRADVEVDIDLENSEEGVYLWGALVTDRAGAGAAVRVAAPGYRAFAAWEPPTPELELSVFVDFWSWLAGVRADASAAGRSFRVYCYNESAEGRHLRRLAKLAGTEADVEAFLSSDEWVDLLAVVRSQVTTGGGLGLKEASVFTGYAWTVEDPGGEESMLRYESAIAGDATASAWLLAYNQGDVEATLALRDWLDVHGEVVPAIESVDPLTLG